MLAEGMFVAGIIILILSIYKKQQLYDSESIEEELASGSAVKIKTEKKHQKEDQKLEEVSTRLDQIADHLERNKEELSSELAELKDNIPARESKNNAKFADVFQEKYQNVDNGLGEENSLPEKYNQVMEMVAQGKESQEIAEELELGIRETEMILKLYQGKADTNG